MIIKREQFIEELQLREQVRRIIKVVKKRRALSEHKDEESLRAVIRHMITEQEMVDNSTDRPTGIRVLDEEVLQNIVPVFEKYYKQLAKPEQRESFRIHVINAVENLLKTAGSGMEVTVDANAPAQLAEVELSVGGGPKDDPMFIPVGSDAESDPESEAKDDFRSGMEGNLSDDAEIGAERAQLAFNGPDTTIQNAFKTLRGDDAALFTEYLITNLKLHFDAFEEELGMPDEPTTPSYEEEASGAAEPPADAMGAPLDVPPPMPGGEALPPEPPMPPGPMG